MIDLNNVDELRKLQEQISAPIITDAQKLDAARADVQKRKSQGHKLFPQGVAIMHGITLEQAKQLIGEKTETKIETTNYPVVLKALVEAKIARLESDGNWVAPQCQHCGQVKAKCCGQIQDRVLIRQDEETLTSFGRQAVGLDPIIVPKSPKSEQQIAEDRKKSMLTEAWFVRDFHGVSEFKGNGTVKMYIENFLPEGVTLICGLPKEGKSFLGMSVAKALTSGTPLFGRREYDVPEPIPVLYLAAESGDNALKLRCAKFGITEDKTMFLARTLSDGPMLSLEDPSLEQAVKTLRPVIILETLIRFNEGNDEDSSTQNAKLANDLFRLIGWGARAVIGIHHSRKDLNKQNPTKESAVRGSGDGLAMVDCVWLVMQDEQLYQGGKGANEVDVIGWGRDFSPSPIRLALTKKVDIEPGKLWFGTPGIVSCIDQDGDFGWVDKAAASRKKRVERQDLADLVEQAVIANPIITRRELAEQTGRTEWEIRNVLKHMGYQRPKGGKQGESRWEKQSKAP